MTTLAQLALDVAQAMAKEIQPIVSEIEGGPQTTQGHYARYLTILSRCQGKAETGLMALALVKAGASRQGVASALKILGYV